MAMMACTPRKGKRKLEEDPSPGRTPDQVEEGSLRSKSKSMVPIPNGQPQLDFYNAIFETRPDQRQTVDASSSGDGRTYNLIILREQLGTSHKREEVQKRKLSKLTNFNNYSRIMLRKIIGIWNQLDEDVRILKNRIHNGEYKDLGQHLVTPSTVLGRDYDGGIEILEKKLQEMVKSSGELISHALVGIQNRLERSGIVWEAIGCKSGGDHEESLSSSQILQVISQEEYARMREEIEAFRKFGESFKSLETEYVKLKSKLRGKISDALKKKSEELQETIAEMEWEISKRRIYSASLNVQVNDARETFQNCQDLLDIQIVNLANNPSNIDDGAVATTAAERDVDTARHLIEIEKLQTSEEKALGVLRKLQFETNNRTHPAIMESVTYSNLEEGVTLIETHVKERFEELESLLDQFISSCSQMMNSSLAAEKMEFEKHSKARRGVLMTGERIEIVKQYLSNKRHELILQQAKEAHFQPLKKETAHFIRTLESRQTLLVAERDHHKINFEEALIERGKLLTVDKEMLKRIFDLEKWLSSKEAPSARDAILLLDEDGVEIVPDQPVTPEECEINELKYQLMKAKSERSELQFQVDIFTHKIVPNPNKPSAEESLKSVRMEIDRVKESIKKLKHIRSVQTCNNSLSKELEKKKNGVDLLLKISEPFGTIFDDLRDKNSHLKELAMKLPDSPLPIPTTHAQFFVNGTDNQLTGDAANSLKNRVKWQRRHDELMTNISVLSEHLQKLHVDKVYGILTQVSVCETESVNNIQTDYYKSELDKVTATLQEKSDALQKEVGNQVRLISQINQIKLQIERLEGQSQQSTQPVDEVAMEQIREYKELLMCPSCNVNFKDAITKCQHIFCNVCLKKVRRCPQCYLSIRQKDVSKLYLV